MEEVIKVDMKDYYNHRQIIRQLYMNDTVYGDIAGSLLGLREQNPNIESMSLEIQSFRIRIELVHGKTDEENSKILQNVGTVYNKVATIISNFISANIDKITDPQTAIYIQSNIHNGTQYFDLSHVGNMIEITL